MINPGCVEPIEPGAELPRPLLAPFVKSGEQAGEGTLAGPVDEEYYGILQLTRVIHGIDIVDNQPWPLTVSCV